MFLHFCEFDISKVLVEIYIGANLWRNEVLTGGGPTFSRSIFLSTESPFEHTNYANTKYFDSSLL